MKRNHSVGYYSSYDRGLDTLLDIWPDVLKAVPDASLEVAYGWNTFDQFHSKNPERMKWKWQILRKFNEYGVKEHGRLSHTDLAKLMESTQVLAYPTSFAEIDCITVKKAQAAKMDVVTSGYAALQESVLKDEPEIEDIEHKPAELKKYTKRLIDALLHPRSDAELEADKQHIISRYNWGQIAKEWDAKLSATNVNVWEEGRVMPQMMEFDINNYDAFYEHHYFKPMTDGQALEAGKYLARVRWAVEVAKELKPKRILDLGCLEGFTQFSIANVLPGVSGVGVDLSYEAIASANQRAQNFGMDFTFLQGRLEDYLENCTEKFDMITSFEVMEHVEDPELVIKLMDKVLAPGGQILISTPDFESPVYGKDDEDNKCHIRLYTLADDDYEAENKYGHTRKATSMSKQIGKDRIIELETVEELINCRYGAPTA